MIQARDLFVSIQILSNLAMHRQARERMRDGAILDALRCISNRPLSHGTLDCSHYLLQVPCQPSSCGRRPSRVRSCAAAIMGRLPCRAFLRRHEPLNSSHVDLRLAALHARVGVCMRGWCGLCFCDAPVRMRGRIDTWRCA